MDTYATAVRIPILIALLATLLLKSANMHLIAWSLSDLVALV